MAISVNWITGVIYVPQADLNFLGGSIYQLDVDAFRLILRDLEDDPDGRPWQKTHNHNTEVTLSGVTYARIFEILAPYTVEFENGNYSVSCTNANHNIADRKVVNSVSLIINNSAGLTNLEEIQNLSFFGRDGPGVTLDVINGEAGTFYPIGGLKRPVNNITDALTILTAKKYNRLYVRGDLTTGVSDNLNSLIVVSESDHQALITITSGTTTQNTNFRDTRLEGIMNGHCDVHNCEITTNGISNFSGDLKNCELEGNISCNATGDCNITDCKTTTTGSAARPSLIANNNPSIAVRGHVGSLNIKNVADANCFVCLDVLSGNIYTDSSCTNGNIIIRGGAGGSDNAGAGCNIDRSDSSFPYAVWDTPQGKAVVNATY